MRALPSSRWMNVAAAAAVVVVVVGIAVAGPVLAPLLFTFLAAILCRPAHRSLLRRGLPGWAAMLLPVAAYALVLGSLGLVLAVSLVGLAADLPAYLAAAPPLPEALATAVDRLVAAIEIDEDAVVAALAGLAASVVGAAVFVAFSALVLAYLLLDADRLRSRLEAALPEGSPVLPAYARLAGELVEYVKVRAILGAAAAIADTALLVMLGVPSALLWGVVSFLFSFVPNVGFIVALIPPTILGLLVGGLGTAVAVIVGYVTINLLFDYILQPRVMGEALDLAPVVVILSIFAWTWLIGPLGAILAVPLTIVVRAVLREDPALRPVAALLGPPGDPTPAGPGTGATQGGRASAGAEAPPAGTGAPAPR